MSKFHYMYVSDFTRICEDPIRYGLGERIMKTQGRALELCGDCTVVILKKNSQEVHEEDQGPKHKTESSSSNALGFALLWMFTMVFLVLLGVGIWKVVSHG